MNETPESPAINFELSLKELENLVNRIEDGQLTLDESLKIFEKGITLTQQCQKKLSEAEQKVQMLTASQTLEDVEYE